MRVSNVYCPPSIHFGLDLLTYSMKTPTGVLVLHRTNHPISPLHSHSCKQENVLWHIPFKYGGDCIQTCKRPKSNLSAYINKYVGAVNYHFLIPYWRDCSFKNRMALTKCIYGADLLQVCRRLYVTIFTLHRQGLNFLGGWCIAALPTCTTVSRQSCR